MTQNYKCVFSREVETPWFWRHPFSTSQCQCKGNLPLLSEIWAHPGALAISTFTWSWLPATLQLVGLPPKGKTFNPHLQYFLSPLPCRFVCCCWAVAVLNRTRPHCESFKRNDKTWQRTIYHLVITWISGSAPASSRALAMFRCP